MTVASVSLPVDVHGYGTFAGRPAAGKAGREYYASDTDTLYRDNGTTWDTLAPGSGASDLDAILAASGGQDIADALTGAAAPDAGNVFATMADVGGGSSVAYPALKPGTPTDDFNAALSGSWAAHSSGGTFVIGNALAQAIDGSHCQIGYHDQMGAIYLPTTNVDQEWIVGGLKATGKCGNGNAAMPGIAILDTSGNGVAITVYNDSNAYLAQISAWQYTTFSGSVATVGHNLYNGTLQWWLRLTRVGNTWDGYVSIDGIAWTHHMSATRSQTITAAYKAVGMLYDTGATYRGQLTFDYVHTV